MSAVPYCRVRALSKVCSVALGVSLEQTKRECATSQKITVIVADRFIRYDYVVVGGGTAGNAIGVRLAESGFSVAIIEAGIFYEVGKPVLGSTPAGAFFGIGSSFIDAVPTVDWQFQTEPQAGANNRRLHYARGKCLGGSSALNFMIHHRGSKGSYEQWADMVGDESYK
jgi:choline dehydrogenase